MILHVTIVRAEQAKSVFELYFKMILKYAVVIFLYLTLCKADKIEEEIVQMIDDAEKYKEVYLFGGLSIQKIEGSVDENRSVKPHDLLSKLDYYFKTHKLNFEMPDESTLENGKLLYELNHQKF